MGEVKKPQVAFVDAIVEATKKSFEKFGPINPDDWVRIECPDCRGHRANCLLCNGSGSTIVSKKYYEEHRR